MKIKKMKNKLRTLSKFVKIQNEKCHIFKDFRDLKRYQTETICQILHMSVINVINYLMILKQYNPSNKHSNN